MASAEPQDQLSSWFDKTTDKVKEDADWIENEYFVPWRNRGASAFDTHPVGFTLFAVFAALSALPIITFVGFAALSSTVITLAAMTTAFFISATLVISAAFLLLGLLILILILAVSITLSGFGIYLAFRLLFHLRDPKGGGVNAWTAEVRSFLPNVRGIQNAAVQLRDTAEPEERAEDQEPWASETVSASASASTGEAALQSDATTTT